MIKINEVPVGFPAKMANGITVSTLPIPTDAVNCSTYYELFNVSETTDEEGNISANIVKLAEGNSPISESQFASWGQEMSEVEDIVLSNLGLERL